MGVLVYSPGIHVWIDSSRQGLIDVTDDLASGSLALRESNPSKFSFVMLNHARKYDRVFAPNDRIFIQMKRIGPFLPTFSGYLDQVPYITTYPRSVSLAATCTLKRLLYTVWDPGSEAAQNLYPANIGDKADTALDGGIKEMALQLLEKVAGWPRQNTHIGEIPAQWITTIEDLRSKIIPVLDQEAPNIAGTNTSGATGTPGGPATSGSGGPPGINAYMHATRMVESTNNYQAGNGGAYQVLPSNWPHWKTEAGVNDPSTTAEQASAQVQDQVARYKMTAIYNGPANKDWRVVAQVWNGGHPGATTTRTNNAHGQKVPYEDAVLSYMPQFAAEDNTPNQTGNTGTSPGAPPAAPAPAAAPPNTGQPPQPGDKTNTAFVRLCLAQRGDQYIYGAQPNPADPDPKAFDCSSLVQWAAKRIGINLPRTSGEQYAASIPISIQEAFNTAGALLFRGPSEHVVVSMGDGQTTIEARGKDYGVNVFGVAGRQWDVAAKIRGMDYGGGPVAATDNVGVTAGGPGTMGGGALFNAKEWVGNIDPESDILAGHRALLNDVPLLPTVDMVMNASMRSYMSGPNGDFIAWFPDYFGLYGTAGVMVVEDIELQGEGFSVAWNDGPLITHQFTAGARTGASFSTSPGEAVDALQKYFTEGVVTVEFPEILKAVLNASASGEGSDWLDPDKILQRFGVRVNFTPMENINEGPAEFWYAMFLFQQAWAQQFMTQVDLTFMPELWPGMLMRLPGHGLQVYVRAVTHSFDFAGSGFTTRAEVMAPSSPDGSGLWGMLRGTPL